MPGFTMRLRLAGHRCNFTPQLHPQMPPAVLDPTPTREMREAVHESTPSPLHVSLEQFLAWQPDHPNGLKYEWKNGDILMGEDSVNQTERIYVHKLLRVFQKTRAHQAGGELFPESDCYLPAAECVRRPDLAYFSAAQIESSRQALNPVPEFVIEIVSKHDEVNHHEEKLADYFKAGVKVVWHILPRFQAVRIYHSLREQRYAQGPDLCSAAPVLDDFEMRAEEIFA